MKIIFRVDSSVQMGTGHLMRCLTLANELRENGADISFVCRLLPGNLCEYIEQKGYHVHRLSIHISSSNPETQYVQNYDLTGISRHTDIEETRIILKENDIIDWLIVDHYTLDHQWESQIRPYVKKIMVIDDLADRPHNCDLLLDQNLYNNMENRYEKLLPNLCIKLMGPKYALLRPEFKAARKCLRVRNGSIQRILVFFGGGDPTNETAKALEALYLLNNPQFAVDVVVGYTNPHKERIKELCLTVPNITYHCQVENMAELMSRADLAIGAGGSASWERCCLGLPSLVVILADNQCELANALDEQGAIINLGWAKDLTINDYLEAIHKLTPIQLQTISRHCLKLVDGDGCSRVVNHIIVK